MGKQEVMYTPPPLTFEQIPGSAMYITRYNGVEVGRVFREQGGKWIAYRTGEKNPISHMPRGLRYIRFASRKDAGMELVHEADFSS